jgi:hypothetical protein
MYSLLRVCRQATQGDCTIGTLKAFIVSLVKPVAYLSFSVIGVNAAILRDSEGIAFSLENKHIQWLLKQLGDKQERRGLVN